MVIMSDGEESTEQEQRWHMDVIRALSIDYFAIYLVDVEHNTIRTQRANDRMLPQVAESIGREAAFDTVIANYIRDYVHPEDKARVAREISLPNIHRRLLKEKVFFLRYRRVQGDHMEYAEFKMVDVSEKQDASRSVLAVRNVDGEVRREIEQQEALKNALVQMQYANKAKTTFLSNMSHDIRTPMNAIIGFSNIAATHLDDRERVRDCVEKILSASRHLQSLINDILDMSRIESGKLVLHEGKCDLPELFHSLMAVIQPQVREKNLKLAIQTVDIRNEGVYADTLKLSQVLINILSNAVKFTPSGGRIDFTVMQSPSSTEGFAKYSFIVRDTGIGMSQEFQEHIFEPFERETTSTLSQTEGTGLGMSITRSIVEAMGGNILVESAQGQGSTFTVELELRLQEDAQLRCEIRELEGLRILTAGDPPGICDSIVRMLGELSVRDVVQVSGKDAVRIVRKEREDGADFDVVFVDWDMAKTEAAGLTAEIRGALGDRTPIVILTARDRADIEREAKAAGATAFCGEPLFLSDLTDALLRAIHDLPVEESKPEWCREQYAGLKILLVEDNELNREIAVEILTEAGFAVECAENGARAVEVLEASETGHFSLILMDVQMPVMDGYEATDIIRGLQREDLASLPIIAMTANAFEEDRERAIQSGMNDHLAKPLNVEQMLKKINKWI